MERKGTQPADDDDDDDESGQGSNRLSTPENVGILADDGRSRVKVDNLDRPQIEVLEFVSANNVKFLASTFVLKHVFNVHPNSTLSGYAMTGVG